MNVFTKEDFLCDEKKPKLIYFVLMLCVIYITDSGIVNYTGLTGYYASLIALLIAGMYSIVFFLSKSGKTQARSLVLLMAILLIIATFSCLMGSGIGPIMEYCCLMIFSYYVAKTMNFDDFIRTYTNVMVFIAVVSLVTYAIFAFVPGGETIFPVIKLSGRSYRTVFVSNMIKYNWEYMPRMYSLFWEPGVCQAYMNLALFFVIKKKRTKHFLFIIFVLIACIIATRSTTGVFCTTLVMLYYFIFISTKRSKKDLFLHLMVILVLIIITVSYSSIYESDFYRSVFGKLNEGITNASFGGRWYSILGNLKIIIQNPILGVGYTNSDAALQNIISMTNYYIHQTNTLMNYMASFGMLIGGIFVISWWKLARNLEGSIGKSTIVFIIFAICLSGENFIASAFFNIMMMYGYLSFSSKRITTIS